MINEPYKGLNTFQKEDQDIFYGRTKQTELIADHLSLFRLTIVHGASGVGKSSILRAGVAARLRQEANDNLRDYNAPLIAVVVFPPLNHSWQGDLGVQLKQQIAADIQAIAPHIQAPDPELPFIETLEEWTKKIGEGKDDGKLLIILDQFEDFFSAYSQKEEEKTYAEAFAHAVNYFGLRVNFLLSIRSSAFTQLDRFKSLIPNLTDKRIELKRLDRESAKKAITEPLLKIYNDQAPEQWIEIEDEDKIEEKLIEKNLVEEVLNQVTVLETGEIEAPYLQLVMKRLWDEERAHDSLKLRMQTLTSLGGARGIVEEHFKQQKQKLEQEEGDGQIASSLFKYLVTLSGAQISQKAKDLTNYINEDLAVEQKKLPEDKVEKLLAELSYGSSRILRASEGDRYEVYFNVLAEVVADWLKARHRIRQLARDAEKAGQDFAFSQMEALRAVIKAGDALQEIITDIDSFEDSDIIPVRKNLQVILENIREQRQFKYLDSPIYGASISPDGTLFAAASFGGTVCLWDLEQYQEEPIQKLEDPSESVKSVFNLAFSPNGQRLAIASWDGTVHLWDWAKNQLHPPLGKPGNQAISTVAFSPDGQQLATASSDGAVHLWNLQESPPELRSIRDPDFGAFVYSLSFVSRGRQLAIAYWDEKVFLWDWQENKLIRLGTPQPQLREAQPQLLATVSQKGMVYLWDLANPSEPKDKFKAHNAPISYASYDAVRDEIDTVAWDGKVRRWHLKDKTWHEISLNQSPVYRASFSPDRQKLVTVASDGAAHLWDFSDDYSSKPGSEQIVVCKGHQGMVFCVSFSPDGQQLATASYDKSVRLWDCQGKQIKLFEFASEVFRVSFSPNGRYLGIALANPQPPQPTAYLWNLDSDEKIPYKNHKGIVYCVSFNHDGDQVASASEDGTVHLWDLKGKQNDTLSPKSGTIFYVSFSPINQKLAMACVNGKVLIHDLQSKEEVQCIGHASAVYCLGFSPDGKLLASASGDGTARLWDLEGNQKRQFRHQSTVYWVSFSPDGKLLATAGGDGKVYLWQVKDGQKIAEAKHHKGQVFSVCFNHDGQQVATAAEDGTVQLRRIETLKELLKRGRDWVGIGVK